MAETFPYYADGPHYRCSHCHEELPDGATILGSWVGESLRGVRAESSDGTVLHKCGGTVAAEPGEDAAPESVEAWLAAVQSGG